MLLRIVKGEPKGAGRASDGAWRRGERRAIKSWADDQVKYTRDFWDFMRSGAESLTWQQEGEAGGSSGTDRF